MDLRLIITDLTEMHGGNFCVAGWDIQAKRMVRPLPGGSNWTSGLLNQHSMKPGATVDVQATGHQHLGTFPHRTEDTNITVAEVQLVDSGPINWFGQNAPPTYATVANAFGGHLQHSRIWNGALQGVHMPENTQAGSLSAIQVSADSIKLFEDNYQGRKSLRAYLDDGDVCYNLPVVAKDSRATYRAHGVAGVQLTGNQPVHVRLGLARAWAGQPGRCSLMINGIYG